MAAGKAAEKAAAESVAASQAHEKLRQVVAGLQQSQAAVRVRAVQVEAKWRTMVGVMQHKVAKH